MLLSSIARNARVLLSAAFLCTAVACGGGGGGSGEGGGTDNNQPPPAAGTLTGRLLYHDSPRGETYLDKADASSAPTLLTTDGDPAMWPDGSQYLEYKIGGGGNGSDQITVYATATRQVIYQLNNVPYFCGANVRPSPVSKKQIVVQCYQNFLSNEGLVAVFDLEAGSVVYYEAAQPRRYKYRWLPDGRLLRVHDETGALAVKSVGSASWQSLGQIAVPSGRRVFEIEVNPQGTMLVFAFQGYSDYAAENLALDSDIWVSKIDGSSLERFTSMGWVFDPIWSPDGSYIAFSVDTGRYSAGSSGGAPYLWYAPASARNMSNILNGFAHPSATQFRRRYPSGDVIVMVGVDLRAWVQ